MSKPVLQIKNLTKSFEDSHLKVLDAISLNVRKGELVSIIGPSGCGKSTLLDCIAGLTVPDSGQIQIAETPAYMFQDDIMFPWRTVLDNVLLPLEVKGMKKKEAREKAWELLQKFGFEKFVSYYPSQLSGGMKERASLLRTYLCQKEFMLLDEPFSKLDAITKVHMQQWFLETLQASQKTVLFVTHDVEEAIFLADRIYVLSQRPGKIIKELAVPFRKQRTAVLSTSKEFVAIKKQIIHVLQ
jgi:ABC-type nitrate/sulfonate/bicarbonate transport system ATPase subunit